MPTSTQDSFHSTSWHDNYVHAMRFVAGPDGVGELHFDIDHIVEWLRTDTGTFRFKVAPASLRFLGVTDLRLQLSYSAASAAMGPFQILGIERRFEPRAHNDAIIWTMPVSFPPGEIAFEATGYSQEINREPQVVDRQWLLPAERGDV